jgi:hypothetical protein
MVTAILSLPACRATIPEPQDRNNSHSTNVRLRARRAQAPEVGVDGRDMTFALIAVGVELFGLACGVALARAAATDDL